MLVCRCLTRHELCRIVSGTMNRACVVGAVVLALLVFWVPVAMASGACATMMDDRCEGPCGASSCPTVLSASDLTWPGPDTDLAPQVSDQLPTDSPASLEPPPKAFLLPA